MGQPSSAAASGARFAGPAQVPFLLHVHGSQAVAVRVLAGHREMRSPEAAGGRRPAAKTRPQSGCSRRAHGPLRVHAGYCLGVCSVY